MPEEYSAEGLSSAFEDWKKEHPEEAPAPKAKARKKRKASRVVEAEVLADIWAMPFVFMAARVGDFWKLTDAEKDKLGELSLRTCELWNINLAEVEKFLVLASLCGCVLQVTWARVKVTRDLLRQKREAERGGPGTLAGQAAGPSGSRPGAPPRDVHFEEDGQGKAS